MEKKCHVPLYWNTLTRRLDTVGRAWHDYYQIEGTPHRHWSDTSPLFKERTLFGLKTSQTMLILMYVFFLAYAITMDIAPAAALFFTVGCVMAAVIGFTASCIEDTKKRNSTA